MAPQNRPLKLSIVGSQEDVLSVKMQKLLCSVKKEGNINTERNAERREGWKPWFMDVSAVRHAGRRKLLTDAWFAAPVPNRM